ncbi:hypothetical protein Pcinc_029586 [Petrolisthes cinctipes]|uniref:Uncharacterized protein n=1 Tax=Petrolisthes cinctipes TaxID=88211 RepID=A0AAE1EZS4_PETCI|nr:hypothetical protein Pcinc_029586 [Petrolisthes cinctipes]
MLLFHFVLFFCVPPPPLRCHPLLTCLLSSPRCTRSSLPSPRHTLPPIPFLPSLTSLLAHPFPHLATPFLPSPSSPHSLHSSLTPSLTWLHPSSDPLPLHTYFTPRSPFPHLTTPFISTLTTPFTHPFPHLATPFILSSLTDLLPPLTSLLPSLPVLSPSTRFNHYV